MDYNVISSQFCTLLSYRASLRFKVCWESEHPTINVVRNLLLKKKIYLILLLLFLNFDGLRYFGIHVN